MYDALTLQIFNVAIQPNGGGTFPKKLFSVQITVDDSVFESVTTPLYCIANSKYLQCR